MAHRRRDAREAAARVGLTVDHLFLREMMPPGDLKLVIKK